MSDLETDIQQDAETLEHLLSVVVENREKRCLEIREKADQQAREIIKQVYVRGRARMHRHVIALREKYRLRVTSANARNQTLLRQQHQKVDRATLDVAWPLLREAMLALWKDPYARRKWLDAAIASASTNLREISWHIECPQDLTEEEKTSLKQTLVHDKGSEARLTVRDDIEAGIRIVMHGTVIDATLEGLLKQKTMIEGIMIARIKQSASSHA